MKSPPATPGFLLALASLVLVSIALYDLTPQGSVPGRIGLLCCLAAGWQLGQRWPNDHDLARLGLPVIGVLLGGVAGILGLYWLRPPMVGLPTVLAVTGLLLKLFLRI